MTPPTAPDTNAIRQRLEKMPKGTLVCRHEMLARGGSVVTIEFSDEVPDDGCEAGLGSWFSNNPDAAAEAVSTFIDHAPADIAALLANNQRLREALEKAAPHVCENLCPSKWRTADGPPPHHETCRQITDALQAKEGDTP